MSTKDLQDKIKQITEISTPELLKLERLEEQIFGKGALNRWTLPVIARYGYLYVFSIADNIVGAASYVSQNKTAFLVGFWIQEKFRNQGLGEVLLRDSLSQLTKESISKVEVTVSDKNKVALKLYEKIGFILSENLEDFYGPDESRLLLVFNLLK